MKHLIIALRAAASKVFPTDEEYYAWLGNEFSAERTRDLTPAQMKKALDQLNKLTGHTSKKRKHGSGTRFLSQAQADKIGVLEQALAWHKKPERLTGFIKRQTGQLKSVSMLTPKEASMVIVGLQRVAARGDKTTYKTLNEYS